MRVLITGNLGYIGHVLTQTFLSNNFEVVGLDAGHFKEFLPDTTFGENFRQIIKDVRDISENDLNGIDVVVHLAAISNDPSGELNPRLTNEINFLATKKLVELSKLSGVEKFLFSSSCAVYGVSNGMVNEYSECKPLTAYAKSKLLSEKEILNMSNKNFKTVVLRSATAFGVSPRMRFDLVVNSMTARAFMTSTLELASEATIWRPLVHIKDISRAFLLASRADSESVGGQIFNVGGDSQNHQVQDIAKIVSEEVSNTKIVRIAGSNNDQRTYQVDFTKIKDVLGFAPKISVRDGVKEVHEYLKTIELKKEDFESEKYQTVKRYKNLLEAKAADLRFE